MQCQVLTQDSLLPLRILDPLKIFKKCYDIEMRLGRLLKHFKKKPKNTWPLRGISTMRLHKASYLIENIVFKFFYSYPN